MEERVLTVLLVASLIAGAGVLTPPTSSSVTPDDSIAGPNVSVEIDCTAGNVTIVAPPNYEHRATVRLVHVASPRTFVAGGRLAPTAGNRTVGIRRNDTGDTPEEAYVFVRNASTDADAEPVAVARRTCDAVHQSMAPDRPHERNGTVVPAISIDCEAGAVRFDAPEDAAYYQRTSSVVVDERSASIGGSGGTGGWTDENVNTNGTVFVTIYDERPLLRGEPVYTVYERCGGSLETNATTNASLQPPG